MIKVPSSQESLPVLTIQIPQEMVPPKHTTQSSRMSDKLSVSDEAYIPLDNASISDTIDGDRDVDDDHDSSWCHCDTVPISGRSVAASDRVTSLVDIFSVYRSLIIQ